MEAAASYVPLHKKIYLTLPEASQYSGLSTAFLNRLIARKRLRTFFDDGYRIKRTDLKRINVKTDR